MPDYPPLTPLDSRLPQRHEDPRAPAPWTPPFDEPLLRDYARILKKRRGLIAGVFLATLALVASATLPSTPIYTAETLLLIEPQNPQIIDIPQVLGDTLGKADYYETQYEILKSRSLAERVIRQHGLSDAELGGRRPSALASAIRLVRTIPSSLFSNGSGSAEDPTPEQIAAKRVNAYLDALSVGPSRDTRLVKLSFRSPDPLLAARLINAHARAYIEQGPLMRARASEEARAFLEEKLQELKDRVGGAQADLNAYSREEGIVSLDDKANVVIERLADLNARLTAAEAERVAREAEFRLIQERRPGSLPAVLASPLVTTLKQELARLEGEQAFLSTRFSPGYPRLAQLQSQIAESRRRLSTEIRTIVDGIESSFLAAKAQEEDLRARVDLQKIEALRLKDASVEYAMLEHDLKASRQLYENVLGRIKQTEIAVELRDSNVFIVDPAHPPLRPSGLSTKLIFALAGVLGLIAAIGLALIAEFLDSRIRNTEDVERQLGLPSLGAVPDFLKSAAALPTAARRQLLAARSAEGGAPRPGLLHSPAPGTPSPNPVAVEAYRTVRTNILLSQAGRSPRTILFTSGAASEGKTVTTVNTAAMFAQLGGPVLVIDADLRKPGCHRLLGIENLAGLTEILTGGDLTPDFLKSIDAGFSFLSSGKKPPNPTELLGSTRMRQFLASARDRFEYILIDGPPMLPVSDSVVLATLVDGVVLVADQQKTPRHVLRSAQARLTYARAKVLGVVLNRADVENEDYSYFVGWQPSA